MHLLRVRQSGENLQINRFRSVQSPSLRKNGFGEDDGHQDTLC